MAVTDLTGTTWKFNNTVDMAGYYYLLDYYEGYLWIDFTTAGGISCAAMDGSSSIISYRSGTAYTVYTTANGWVSPDYQTITITGGSQAKGSLFINWFTANATQIRDDYFTCTDELTSIADAIRAKGGTSASLTYPSGFVTAINNLPTKVLGAGTISGYDSPFDIQVTADDYSAGEWDGFSSVSINIGTPLYDGSCDIINPVSLITFTIARTTYQAEEGMTWAEWVASEYNIASPKYGFVNGGLGYMYGGTQYMVYLNDRTAIQSGEDVIVPNAAYSTLVSGGGSSN